MFAVVYAILGTLAFYIGIRSRDYMAFVVGVVSFWIMVENLPL